jgi:segregation and condensation protein B
MRKLAQLAGLADATEARTLVRQINQLYTERGRAFRVEEVAGGVQILTRPQLAPWLRRLGHIPKTVQLTSPAMETLAIVAYRQPVLRAEIEAIRGVACGELLKQLMEKDLVRISGRSEELGRPYLYSTTKSFLQIFGLRGADALPALDDATVEIYEPAEELAGPPPVSPEPDQQPETIPEEDLDVSTAVANLVTDNPECDNDAYVDLSDSLLVSTPYAVDEDEDEDFGDEDEDEDYDDDDDDWDEEEEDDEIEDEDVEEDDEVDADWEEVEDEEWEEDEEGDEEESEEDEDEELDDDDWDDEDDEDDAEDEDDEEWD